MIFWVIGNAIVLLTVRTFATFGHRHRKNAYTLLCSIGFIAMSHPMSNGGPAAYIDEIDNLLALSDDDLLEEVQKATFKYFWDFAHPVSGLIRERNTSGDLVTSGGSGFGIMAIVVGIHRNFITRDEGLERIQKMVTFLAGADRFHGAWSHWLDGSTGKVRPFSARDDGGDLVETAYLIQGLLTARAYFDRDEPAETTLRSEITDLWESVDWNWYRKQVNQVLTWHWSPNHGFDIDLPIRGWNETMITYILGIAAPKHTLPPSTYEKGWASGNYVNGNTYYGYKLEVGRDRGGPLFFTHYSFLGFDPRNKKDAYANYYFQGKNQTLINRAWCIQNPKNFMGYGPDCWGLTASDDPQGYKAHAPSASSDNGTVTPSAAISSIVYTPSESVGAIRHFLDSYREKVWGDMGFYDAFNPSQEWFATSYLAIDQGPIICMIENYRSGLLWDYFMRNEEINIAIDKIGFVADESTTSVAQWQSPVAIYPNPSAGTIYFDTPNELEFVAVMDDRGSAVQYAMENNNLNRYTMRINDRNDSGVYFIMLKTTDQLLSKKVILVRDK